LVMSIQPPLVFFKLKTQKSTSWLSRSVLRISLALFQEWLALLW
jgi:hypothetical protein